MALIQLDPPALEPVTRDEAKNHLRIDSDMTNDDLLIDVLIATARRYGEMVTGRSFITQKWRRVLDYFPCNLIELDRGQVQTVDAVTYLDLQGDWQTMDPATIALDLASLPARISPIFGAIWPIPVPQIGSVRVDYTAGFGDGAEDVPEGIRQWILLRLTTLYEHREEAEIVSKGRLEPMPFVDGLLDPYKVVLL